jgi:uracil-DNA glycosylase
MTWDDLPFWEDIKESTLTIRLNNTSSSCPSRLVMFKALDLTPFDKVKVMWIGQDPYPDPQYATGVAFSIPKDVRGYPPTLNSILREYCTDLRYKRPANGNLEKWCAEGVLLWNVYATCEPWKSLSHEWEEYEKLTAEIIHYLSERGKVVFIFSGRIARQFAELVDEDHNCVIETSHPSPRGSLNSNNPFIGSRIFSRTNEMLVQELGVDPVDWYLEELPTKRNCDSEEKEDCS